MTSAQEAIPVNEAGSSEILILKWLSIARSLSTSVPGVTKLMATPGRA